MIRQRSEGEPPAAGLLDRPTFLLLAARATIVADDDHTARPVVLWAGVSNLQSVTGWFGQQAGERLMQVVGAAVTGHLPAATLVARMADDEIAVLLTAPTDAASVQQLATEVHAVVAAQHDVDGRSVSVDASIGIAFGEHGLSVRELASQAEAAMYRARVTSLPMLTFEPSRPIGHDERSQLRADLTHAARVDQLLLHYQPVVELRTGRLVGLEALLRWNHPTRGVLPAREILQTADDTGLVNELAYWVLRQVERDLTWLAPAATRPITLTINLSADNLSEPGIVERLSALIGKAPGQLSIMCDFAEEALANADPAMEATVKALHASGALIAVDDFSGDGSVTGYLRRLPVHTLKLAPQLTHTIVTTPRTSALVAGIRGICDRMGVDLVAEAVEHRQQRDALIELGCTLGQGWLFGKSVSGPEFAAALSILNQDEPAHDDEAVAVNP